MTALLYVLILVQGQWIIDPQLPPLPQADMKVCQENLEKSAEFFDQIDNFPTYQITCVSVDQMVQTDL